MPTASSSSGATRATSAPILKLPSPTRATAKPRPSPNWLTTSTRCSPSPTSSPPSCHPSKANPPARQPTRCSRTPAPAASRACSNSFIDHSGKDDIYRLADDLGFEIDDLLPIVDAAQLLGFLTVKEGDAAITPTGSAYAHSEILRQKELFRAAAVENVLLLRQIVRAIEAKKDGTVSEEFFHDMLDEQFTEEETLRQLETAVNWGPLRGALRLRRLPAAFPPH